MMDMRFNSVHEAFRASVRRWADRPFLRIIEDTARRYDRPSGVHTYGETDEQVERLVVCYRARGLGPGRRVALLLENRPEFLHHWLALNALGASVVPLNADWGAAELEYVLAHSEACMAVTLAAGREALESALAGMARPPRLATAEELSQAGASPGRGAGPGSPTGDSHRGGQGLTEYRTPDRSGTLPPAGAQGPDPGCAPDLPAGRQGDAPPRPSGEDGMPSARKAAATSAPPRPSREDRSASPASGWRSEPSGRDAECALLYTSGTTGRPKGCILSNEYFLWGGDWYRRLGGLCALRPGEECLATPLPMHHMNALAVSTMAMLMTGGCIAPLDRFHPSSWWASVREADATIIHYLGVMPAILLDQPQHSLDVQHRVRFGFGAGVSAAHHERFERRFGFPLVEAWAMTETGLAAAVIANRAPRKIGTACFGRPPPQVEWRIVDEDGADAGVGEPGELLVRRAGEDPRFGFFSGYLKDAQATQAAWRGGYFHTGDVVRQDPDGLLHFVDRKKNIIRRSGENIAAVEVEAVVAEHPAVAAVGVAPVPDQVRGDEVMALVVLGDASAPDDQVALARGIVRHCLGRLAYYKAPGYIAFCASLPLTATEKIQRAALKTLALARLEANTCVDTRSLKRRRPR